ncbi:hypothetical protein DEGR_09440 [Deinococcus grandis]|nr:hypothetical protein DEGR_09440 [Deinococcus grandis]
MMDIFNMLGGMGQAQQTVARQTGASPDQTQAAIQAALPLLLGALTRNAAQPGGLDALSGALNRHDGSALDAFTQGQAPDTQDGQKILGHVFGAQQGQAAQAVGKRAGIDPQLAMQIMSMLAPLVLAYLSRQRQGGAANTTNSGGGMSGGPDLGSILGGLVGAVGWVACWADSWAGRPRPRCRSHRWAAVWVVASCPATRTRAARPRVPRRSRAATCSGH